METNNTRKSAAAKRSPAKEAKLAQLKELSQATDKVLTYLEWTRKRGSHGRYYEKIYLKKIATTIETLTELKEYFDEL